ncbi:Sporulation kinase A [Enhygromyxa salina]|uniref:histidine kinase n=2 Tax=Enhygromyxa salina TaxID=215803 RepID=A0A2S9YK86_9BACT|nr:Sporulation kinase A [Enhygromyxa salina]
MPFADVRARMGREELYKRRTARLRVYLTVGVSSSVLEWMLLWLGGVEPWRILVLAGMFGLSLLVSILRRSHLPPSAGEFTRFSLVFQTQMAVRLALTGGLYSPMLPALGVMIVQPVIFLGAAEYKYWLGAWMLTLVVIVGLLPTWVTGPVIAGWPYAALVVLALLTAMVIVGEFMRISAHIQERATDAIVALHDERVAEAEAQNRRLQAVGGKVAHELKNPLAAIKGLVQLVARGAHEARTQQRLDVVESEISRMEVILREYLSFSRPLEDLEPEPVDLAALVEQVVVVIAGRAEQAKVRISLETRPVALVGDPRRLKEALLNALANAIEATPPGGGVHVTTNIDGEGGRIEILDTGRGIQPEHLERLGTSFFTTRPDGTGLGVVLVVGVVAQHGGHLHVASEPGRGTRLTIWLPCVPNMPIVAPTTERRQVLTTSTSLRDPKELPE